MTTIGDSEPLTARVMGARAARGVVRPLGGSPCTAGGRSMQTTVSADTDVEVGELAERVSVEAPFYLGATMTAIGVAVLLTYRGGLQPIAGTVRPRSRDHDRVRPRCGRRGTDRPRRRRPHGPPGQRDRDATRSPLRRRGPRIARNRDRSAPRARRRALEPPKSRRSSRSVCA